jgi:hypothetical protein
LLPKLIGVSKRSNFIIGGQDCGGQGRMDGYYVVESVVE